jgi:alpha-N-arabinofuranosidase
MITRSILGLAATVSLCSGCAFSASRVVTIDATAEQAPISPYVYGQFIEHLGRCIYGGIWAEMLEDRKFFYPVDGKRSGWGEHQGKEVSWEGEGIPYEILTASPWQIIGPADAVSMNTSEPLAGDQDVRVDLAADEARGIHHPRLALETAREYTGYIVARNEGATIRVEVVLLSKEGADTEVVATFDTIGESFTKLPFKFTAKADANDARLVIRATGEGQLYIGAVSLMPADNVDGFRADTLALLRELNSPIYRWPGGNFVSGYDWRDGIGDRDRRPPRKNPAWTGIEHNDVGIHEFMRFCELVKTEPFIALNTGLGDVTSAALEVEYIVGAPDTAEGAKRAANGRNEPWPATWWAVGNEMYGDWQLGHMPLDEYVKKHNAVVDAIRAVSPEAQCIGVGSAGKWSETMLTESADHMKLISEHLYWQQKKDVTEHAQVAVDQIEKLAATHRDYRRSIEGLEEKDIRIALDEWNFWYGPYLYGELGTRYFHRDGLGCAAALHAMFRNSDLFFMANYAQTVNVIGAIKTTQTDAWLETTGQVLKLYRQHFGTQPVQVSEEMSGVDVVAAWNADRSALTIAAVNTRAKAVKIQLEATGIQLPEEASGWRIQNDDPEAYNDETQAANVAIHEVSVSMPSGSLELPAYSVSLIQIPAGP